MKQRLIYSILLILVVQLSSYGQSMNAFIKAADNAFEQSDYYSALEYYSTAFTMDSTQMDIRYKQAESARLFNAYTKSIEAYNEVMDSESASQYMDGSFWLGSLYQKVGDYESAIKNYEMYLSEYEGANEYFTAKAKVEIEASKWAQTEKDNIDVGIRIEHLDATVNTPYTEFGAIDNEEVMYYTSMKYNELKSKRNPSRLISKILQLDTSGIPSELTGYINTSELSVAHTAFNTTGNIVYYTLCSYINDSDLKCDIYSRNVAADGSFTDAQKLSINYPGDSITTTQPSIGIDPSSGQEMMVFSSNRPGGKGKMDLWKSIIAEDNTFSEPENIGDLNTKENDITPFFHNPSSILYFSSDGRRGIGGYDIFSSDWTAEGQGELIHLGVPLNTSFNDIYYSLSDDELSGYFSSNRTGSYFIDQLQEACCYDIYKANFENVIINLDVITFDGLILDSLNGATVKLIDPISGDIIATITNELGSHHEFELKRGRNYIIVSELEGFNPDTVTVSTRGKRTGDNITKKVYLSTDRLLLDASVFDKHTLEELSGATLEVIDKTNGNKIIYNQLNPINNNFKVYLDKDIEYEIRASKEEYSTAIIILDTSLPQEGQIIYKKLFLDKNDINRFLPLVLFFDNDRPDRRSVDMYTAKSYSDVYYPYVDRKEEFKTRYSRRLKSADREVAKQDVEMFFENNVKGGYQDLLSFFEKLHSYLLEGRGADLAIRGYTSPLAATKYNLALGQRRVSSVKNEIRRYKNGVLMPFLEAGQLKITDISYGETLAPSEVSDRRNDTSNSIYSVNASKERRVEIVRIEIN